MKNNFFYFGLIALSASLISGTRLRADELTSALNGVAFSVDHQGRVSIGVNKDSASLKGHHRIFTASGAMTVDPANPTTSPSFIKVDLESIEHDKDKEGENGGSFVPYIGNANGVHFDRDTNLGRDWSAYASVGKKLSYKGGDEGDSEGDGALVVKLVGETGLKKYTETQLAAFIGAKFDGKAYLCEGVGKSRHTRNPKNRFSVCIRAGVMLKGSSVSEGGLDGGIAGDFGVYLRANISDTQRDWVKNISIGPSISGETEANLRDGQRSYGTVMVGATIQ